MTYKFCTGCAHSKKPLFDTSRKCLLPGTGMIDPVDGQSYPSNCYIVRGFGNKCGPEGKYWKAKPTFWQRFMTRFRWWTMQDYNREHLK